MGSTSGEETPGLDVDGSRPAVQWVSSLPMDWTPSAAERLVLLLMALDSYDGTDCAPSQPDLAAWSGMYRSQIQRALDKLCEPVVGVRPALLIRTVSKGRKRNRYRFNYEATDHGSSRLEPTTGVVGSDVQPTTQPTTEPTTEPTTQPTTQPTTEPTTIVGHSLPFPSPSHPSLSPQQRAVQKITGWADDDERLEIVDDVLTAHGVRSAHAWLSSKGVRDNLDSLFAEQLDKKKPSRTPEGWGPSGASPDEWPRGSAWGKTFKEPCDNPECLGGWVTVKNSEGYDVASRCPDCKTIAS